MPNRPMLFIYDGDCGFCTNSKSWIETRVPSESVQFEPFQSIDIDHWGLTEHDVTTAAWLIDGDMKYRGHLAIGHALCRAQSGWKLIGKTVTTPPISWIAAAAYQVVSRNRYRLSSRQGNTCPLKPPT